MCAQLCKLGHRRFAAFLVFNTICSAKYLTENELNKWTKDDTNSSLFKGQPVHIITLHMHKHLTTEFLFISISTYTVRLLVSELVGAKYLTPAFNSK